MTKRKTELLDMINVCLDRLEYLDNKKYNIDFIRNTLNKCANYIKTSRDVAWLRPEDKCPDDKMYHVRLKNPDYLETRLARYISIRDEWIIYPRMDIAKGEDIYAYCEKDELTFSEDLVQH